LKAAATPCHVALVTPVRIDARLPHRTLEQFDLAMAERVAGTCLFLPVRLVAVDADVGTWLRVELALADGAMALAVEGVVAWRYPEGAAPTGRESGIGVNIVSVDPACRARLATWAGSTAAGRRVRVPGQRLAVRQGLEGAVLPSVPVRPPGSEPRPTEPRDDSNAGPAEPPRRTDSERLAALRSALTGDDAEITVDSTNAPPVTVTPPFLDPPAWRDGPPPTELPSVAESPPVTELPPARALASPATEEPPWSEWPPSTELPAATAGPPVTEEPPFAGRGPPSTEVPASAEEPPATLLPSSTEPDAAAPSAGTKPTGPIAAPSSVAGSGGGGSDPLRSEPVFVTNGDPFEMPDLRLFEPRPTDVDLLPSLSDEDLVAMEEAGALIGPADAVVGGAEPEVLDTLDIVEVVDDRPAMVRPLPDPVGHEKGDDTESPVDVAFAFSFGPRGASVFERVQWPSSGTKRRTTPAKSGPAHVTTSPRTHAAVPTAHDDDPFAPRPTPPDLALDNVIAQTLESRGARPVDGDNVFSVDVDVDDSDEDASGSPARGARSPGRDDPRS
jgi:Tfp pilus assembly protein PilZ